MQVLQRSGAKFLLLAFILVRSFSAVAQCTINEPSDITGCKGLVTFIATSQSSTVTHHVWYDQFFNAIAPTEEHKIEYQPGTGQVAWTSSLTVSLQGNATYYVAASCDTNDKRMVTFTAQNGAPISLSMIPNVQPNDLCLGETVTLKASGGTAFEWRDPSGGVLQSDTKMATQSGTYYLTGYNACNEQQSQQVTLTFKPQMTNVSISGGPSTAVCANATPTSQFTANGDEVSYFTWGITGAGNVISPAGIATWDPAFFGNVTVTLSAYGCHNTVQTKTKTIYVSRQPTASITSPTSVTIPFRTDYITLAALSSPEYSYQWYTFSPNTPVEGATGSSLIVSGPGDFYVKVTNSDNCSLNSSFVSVKTENNYNYIIENILQDSKLQNGTLIGEAEILTLDANRNQQTIQYIDGLGRPMQNISTQASPAQKDFVQPVIYDAFSRESTKYLPYVSTQANGWYKVNPIGANAGSTYTSSDQYQFYQQPSTGVAQGLPYAATVFEPSPLNRVLKQGSTGSAWQPSADPLDLTDRTVKRRYEANLDADVLLFNYDESAGTISLKSGSAAYYIRNDLYANRTIDEQGNEIIEYADLKGRVICKRVQSGISGGVKSYANTYYVYDAKDHLVVVVPPEALATILNQPH